MAVGVRRHDPAMLPPGRRTGSNYEEHGWVLGPVWFNMEMRKYLAPARIQSLYQLSYPGSVVPVSRYINNLLK
jgi:hypothetical protein